MYGSDFGLNWQTATEEDVQDWLESTAYVNARDKDGVTPLHRAARFNENPGIIIALVEAGTDVNARDKDVGTPLHRAARFNENPGIIDVLLNAGADVNVQNSLGDHTVARCGGIQREPGHHHRPNRCRGRLESER